MSAFKEKQIGVRYFHTQPSANHSIPLCTLEKHAQSWLRELRDGQGLNSTCPPALKQDII